MKTINLNVPHLSRALQRGERVVLQDVLRLERLGDDLLAWVRQVDGSVQLQRLEQFFAADMQVILEVRPGEGERAEVQIISALSELPQSVLTSSDGAEPARVAAHLDVQGDVLWLQLLVNDLAQVDNVWVTLTQTLQGAGSTLGEVYVQLQTVPRLTEASLPRDLSAADDGPSFVPLPVQMQLTAGGVYINQRMQALGASITGTHDNRLAVHLEVVGVQATKVYDWAPGAAIWPLVLTSADLHALGDGPLTLRATYRTSGGQSLGDAVPLQLIIDTQPPAVPTLEMPVAHADGAINLAEAQAGVLLQGRAEAGSTVRLQWRAQTSAFATVTADASGHWQYTASLADLGGRHNDDWMLQVSSNDQAGNPASQVLGQALRIQTLPPSGPTAVLQDTSHTGWSEVATSDTTPGFLGTGPANGKVVWYLDRNGDGLTDSREWLAEASVDSSGAYSLSLPALAAGQTHALLAVAVDRFGNTSETSKSFPLTVDTSVPALPTLDAVTGDNRISYVEYVQGVVIAGTGEPGVKVQVQRQQGLVTRVNEVVVGSDGRWTLTVASNGWPDMTHGNVDVQVRQIDPAGNTSSWTPVLQVPVRLAAVAGVTSLNLLAADDTGVNSADGLTSNTAPTITGMAAPNATVRLVVDSNGDGALSASEAQHVLAEVMADASGRFSWNAWSSTLAQGTDLKILALGWDTTTGSWSNADPVTGLPVNAPQASALHLRVDTLAPLSPVIDTVAGDDLVTVAEMIGGVRFSGTAEAGAQVTVRWLSAQGQPLGLDAQTVTADAVTGVWSTSLDQATLFTLGALVKLEVRVTDAAGNTGSGSVATHDFAIDTTLPAAPSVLQISSDTGTSTSDGLTNASLQVISGMALAGSTVTVFNDLDQDGVLGAGESLAVVTADMTTGAFQTSPLTFADGTYRLRAIATAGSVSSVANQAKVITVDSQAPGVSMTDVAGEAMTSAAFPGAINAAKLTTGTTFGGDAENGLQVTLSFKNASNQTLSHNGQPLTYTTAATSGTWQISLTPAQLSELAATGQGVITAVVTQTDGAGNTGSATRNLTMDTVRPEGVCSQQTNVLALQANGELGGGLIWSEVVDGVLLPVALPDNLGAGGRLTLKWGNQTVEHTVTSTELAQGYAEVSVPSATLLAMGSGVVPVKVSFTDAVGNVSAVDLPVTADTLAASAVTVDLSGRPPAVKLDAGSYHRLISGVHYSNQVQGVTVWLSGEAGAVVSVKEGGNTLTSVMLDSYGMGSAVLQLTPALHTLQVQGSGPGTTELKVMVDNIRPGVPVLDPLVDTLINATERNGAVVITGTCDDRAEVNYWLYNTVTGVVSDTGTTRTSGTSWSAYISLEQWFQVGDGTLKLYVTQTDWAGNTSDPIEALLTLDSAVLTPVVNTVTGDDKINAAEALAGVALSGAGEPRAEVRLSLQGTAGTLNKSVMTDANTGLWTLSVSQAEWTALGEGSIRLTASQTDVAGNVSANTVRTITLDTAARNLSVDRFTGDNHLNLAETSLDQSLSGQGEAGAMVQVHLGNLNKTATVGSNGRWITSFTGQELSGLVASQTLTVTETDLAGNSDVRVSTVTVNDAPLSGSASLTTSGNINWATQANAFTLRGTGPMGTSVSLHLVGARGAVDLGPAVVDGNGAWTISLTSSQMRTVLGAGAVVAQLWAVNASGVQSTALASSQFTLESEIPSPTLSVVAEDGVINLAEKQAGVAIEGTGVANNTIEVTLTRGAATVTHTTPVAANGTWRLPLVASDYSTLGDGVVQLSVVQKANGLSSVAVTTSLTVDVTPPSVPHADSEALAQSTNAASELASGVTAAEAADGVAVVLPLAANAAVGDLVEVFWGSSTTPAASYVVRASDIASGNAKTLSVTIAGDEIALRGSYPNGDLAITYRITDAAGNADVVRTAVSGVTVTAPPQAPQFNAVMTDGYINWQEYNQPMTLTGQVTGSGTMSLRLTGSNGAVLNLSPIINAGSWTQTLSQAQLNSLGEGTVSMQASQVVAGVTSPIATGSFVFDKTLPDMASAAHVQSALEMNADTELAGGLLATSSNNNLTEAYDGTVLNVPLAADAAAGDSLHVFWNALSGAGGIQVDITLTASDVLRGYAAVTISEAVITQAGDNANLRVEAQSVDKAGNAGAHYEVWTGPVDAVPDRPALNAVATNNIINISEMAGAITVSGTAQADRSVQVQLLKGSSLVAHTVTTDSGGIWSWTLSAFEKTALLAFGQGEFEARARQVDVATIPGMPGNPSQWESAKVTIDTVAPNPPTVADITSDNRISANEEAAGVRITGTGEAGATVHLSVMNGSSLLLARSGITVNSSGVWETVLSGADFATWPNNTGSAGVQLSLQLSQSDVAENTSTPVLKTFLYSDDVVVPPTALAVQDVADGYFNAADAVAGLHISGQGTTGSYVRVRITVGDVVTDLPVVQVVGGAWSVPVTGAALTALGQGTATVQAVQRNSSAVDADESTAVTYAMPFVIDTVLPAMQSATVSVLDGTDLSTVKAHAKADDVLLIKVRLSENVTLTPGSTDPSVDLGLSGHAVYDATRSTALGGNWLVFKYTVANNDNALEGLVGAAGLTVDWHGAVLSDAAGNALAGVSITPQAHGIRVDTNVPAMPVVQGLVAAVGESAAADAAGSLGGSTINVAELNAGKALVRVNLGANTLVNDTLKLDLTWSGGSLATVQKTLLAADIANGYALVSWPVQALTGQELTDLKAKAQVVDVAGNASDWTAQTSGWTLDTRAPSMPVIADIATDNKMSAQERAALQDIAISSLEAGATVQAWIEGIDAGTLQTVQRTVSVSVAGTLGTVTSASQATALAGLADGSWTLNVRQTDAAGNTSTTASKTVALDTNVPGNPTLAVAAATDAWVNIAETSAGLTVVVDLRGTRTRLGDELVFTWGTHTHTHVLSAGQPDTLLSLVLPASFVSQANNGPAAGESFDLAVRIVDTGGNASATSGLTGKTLDTLVAAPLITSASLDTVTALEAKSNGLFEGTGAEAGATVVVVLTSSTTGQVRRMSTLAANDGSYSFVLTPSDYKDLGGANATSTIGVSVTQTDRAGNTSSATTGSFRLDLALSPPTFFDLTGDNLVSTSEASSGQVLRGTGAPGAILSVQFFDASAGAGASALFTVSGIVVDASTGRWSTALSIAQFLTLAGGAGGSRTVRTVAIQQLGGSTSDPGTLEFVVDMTTPTITALTRFDANGDGSNNDGLLLTLSEPVKANVMTLLSAYSAGVGESLGTGARVEAIDTLSLHGSTYAQKYRIYLGNGHTLTGSEVLTLMSANVVDMRGNTATSNLTVTVPNLNAIGRPIPPLVVALDNVISDAEATSGVTMPFTITATQSANSVFRVFVNGVQIQVVYNGNTLLDVPLSSTQTTLNVTIPKANWGADGSKTVTAQVVVDPATVNEHSSMFSTSKIAVLDTAVDGVVQSIVMVQHDGDSLLEAGEKIRLTFKEGVKLGAGTLNSVFGTGATVSAVASLNGYAQQWDVTLGTNPTLLPGQTQSLSGGVLTTGVRYVMVRNNASPSDNLSFGELIVLDASGNNIARGKSVTASSSYNAQYDKTKVVDGDATGSETSSWGGAAAGDQWVQVDLGQVYDLNAIIVVPRNNFGEAKSFTVFAGSADMSSQSYAALGANASLYQYNYSSATALSAPLVLGQAVVVIDAAGNIAGSVTAQLPADLMTLPQVGYIDAVSTDNVLSASDLSTASVDVKIVLKNAREGDVVKLFMDGLQVGTRTLLATDVSTGSVSLSVSRSDWGADGERRLQTSVHRGGVSSELSVARNVFVQGDHAHWSQVRDASTIWFDPDNLASLGLGAAVTDWRSSAGGSIATNTDVTQRPILIMVNGHYALNFDGLNDNLNYTDPLSIIPKASSNTVGYDISGFVAIQSQTASGGFRSALSYWGDTPGTGVARGVKLGIQNTQLTYTTYSLLDFYGPSNSVSPNSTTVLTLRDYYDSSAMAYRMQGYNLNMQDINQTGNNARINMTVAPSAMRIGADTNYGIRAYWQGMIGDAIWMNYKVTDAQMFEIQTYLAAKYASVGFWVTQATNGVYRLDTSTQSSPLIDQRVDFRDVVANEIVKTAGADYVQTGRGDDTVRLQDLFFRYADGGQGLDTLQWDVSYNGPGQVVLADYVSNARGLSGNTVNDARVNAAGYRELAGFERLDLRQIGLLSDALETQVLTIAAADIKQLSETHQLEVLLGARDVLKTTGLGQISHGNFMLNGQFYSEKYLGTVDGTQVELYVRGGRLAPEPSGVSVNGNDLQLDFNTALTGADPLPVDFALTSWGVASGLSLSGVSSLNNRQSLYLEFFAPLTVPVKVEYRGASLLDEFGRSMGHTIWGAGTEGNDVLDASAWDSAKGAVILAGSGNDIVTGTAGHDILVGGLGSDTLSGGMGSDRFAYKTVSQGTGGTGGLGGTGGDVITDFNTSSNSIHADVLDLSDLFQLAPGDSLTGDAQHDAQTLVAGGYIDLVRVNSGKDLQVWVDRDGGDVMGQLVTLQDIGTGLGTYFTVSNETSEQLLQRLLTEGRMQVTHA